MTPASWNGIAIVGGVPRLWSASEFARQNPSGVYLHATCVETAALDLRIALDVTYNPPADQIGNILQATVNEWRADNPAVSAGGASTYGDAVEWLRDDLGFRVDANVAGANWWQELNDGLRAGCGFLVGTCNAQGLPGDEPGVQCHGYSAQAVLADGRILCGDPDNAASQVLMPNNPVGHLVAYTQADMARAGVLSLTKVYPMALQLSQVSSYFTLASTDPSGEVWHCTQTGFNVAHGILACFRQIVPAVGSVALPLENERPLGQGAYEQRFERFVIRYDPARAFDSPPLASGPCYLAHIPSPAPPAPPAPPPIDKAGITSDLDGVKGALVQSLVALDDARAKLGS